MPYSDVGNWQIFYIGIIWSYKYICAKSLQLCSTSRLPGPSVHGILQQVYSPPGDLLDPGVEPASPMSPALAGEFLAIRATWKLYKCTPNYKFSSGVSKTLLCCC